MFQRRTRDNRGRRTGNDGEAEVRPAPETAGGDGAGQDRGLVSAAPPSGGLSDMEEGLGTDPEAGRTLMEAVANSDDRQAFHTLVRQLSPSLYGAARKLVQDAYIDDLIQETLVRAWKYRRSFRGEAKPLTWLVAIMKNAAKSPKLRTSETTFGLHLGTEGVDEVDDIETFLRARAIGDALAQLDPVHQELIRRKHLMGQTWVTISQEMRFRSPYFAQKAYESAKESLAKRLDISPSS